MEVAQGREGDGLLTGEPDQGLGGLAPGLLACTRGVRAAPDLQGFLSQLGTNNPLVSRADGELVVGQWVVQDGAGGSRSLVGRQGGQGGGPARIR